MNTILVTGATGNVGSEVVRLLETTSCLVRAAVQPSHAIQHTHAGVEYVPLDFAQPATYHRALEGVTKVFLMRPPTITNIKGLINPFIDAARHAGVQHIVLLSLLGAEKNPWLPHRKIEKYLETAGVPWTFLRPSFFMQNLSTTHRADIQHGDIIVPAGHGKTSFIDVRDIAAVAANVLTTTGHEDQAYALTGAEALSYAKVADVFTDVLGFPVVYRKSSIPQFITHMRRQGMSWSYIVVLVGIYTTARLGWAARVTGETERLLGRQPISMEQFVYDYQKSWQRPVEAQAVAANERRVSALLASQHGK